MFEETDDVYDQITHYNVLCRKVMLYFVSRMLIRFIIKRYIGSMYHVAHTKGPVRDVTVHFDSYNKHCGLDLNGRYFSGEEK